MYYDLLIVGAGPSGLAAAIKFKKMCIENNKDYTVCVVEKGSEVGAHILSGAILQPTAMDELFNDWRDNSALQPTPLLFDDKIRFYVGFRDKNGISRIASNEENSVSGFFKK